MTESSSAYIVPSDFSHEWHDIALVSARTHTLIYTATRYGRRFLLKTYSFKDTQLTDFQLQQEREFQLGIQLVHPNIAATYSLEEVKGIGRCIVQEWIDGCTLCEWLQTKPSRAAQERVFNQLLDALEYLHGLQMVHHDLKADNILITRNGANVKLIDFGLSALDSTLSPVPNALQDDINALRRLFPSIVPNGQYANIAALRRAIQRRRKIVRMLPVVFSVILLIVAAVFFYISWHERNVEQQSREAMITLINDNMKCERVLLQELVSRPKTFDSRNSAEMTEYMAYINEYTTIRQQQWQIRDSIASTYPEDNPMRDHFLMLWNQKELSLDNEFYPQLVSKLR